jgi:hypothetical protein
MIQVKFISSNAIPIEEESEIPLFFPLLFLLEEFSGLHRNYFGWCIFVLQGASHVEVLDVRQEEQPQRWVPEDKGPLRDSLPPGRRQR